MKRGKILMAGSSELDSNLYGLAQGLAKKIIVDTNYVVMSGGLKSKGRGKAFDCLAAEAAIAACRDCGFKTHDRVLTMLPSRDDRGYQRCRCGQILDVQFARRESRRYSMVLACDAVITVGGGQGTGPILDLAWVAEKAMLPIPCTGKKSSEKWDYYNPELGNRLRLSEDEIATLNHQPISKSELINTCVAILNRSIRPQCFVAMKFENYPAPEVWPALCEALREVGYRPVRVDREAFLGSIIDAIWSAIRSADIVVADLTGYSKNVFYELGIAHALGKPTLLTIHSVNGSVPNDLPFDVSSQRVLTYASAEDLNNILKLELEDLRAFPSGSKNGISGLST